MAASTRLSQYQLLQRRQTDEKAAGGDNTAFLRDSNIRVSIEHDLEPHLDRAIELINRTNQLNFTKNRLPEDMDAARAELRAPPVRLHRAGAASSGSVIIMAIMGIADFTSCAAAAPACGWCNSAFLAEF